MLTLYASVADNSGVVKAPNPYGAKIIRSYTEKGLNLESVMCLYLLHWSFGVSQRSSLSSEVSIDFFQILESSRRSYFTFNVSGMGISETLLEAELHLYLLRSEASLLREVRKQLIQAIPFHELFWWIFKIRYVFIRYSIRIGSSSQRRIAWSISTTSTALVKAG